MDIVFDANIIRGDFPLRSTDFDIVLDYLEKTGSSVIVPQIVWDEIIGLYKREFIGRLTKYEAAKGNINILLTDKKKYLPSLAINVDKEADSYEIYLRNRLNLTVRNFLPYNNSYLSEIAKRAISRQKPCGDEGQGFRDAIIWLTIKDYLRSSSSKQIIFISTNYTDFGYKDKVGLHESLKVECSTENITVHYFKSLEEFVQEHSKKIEYINSEWVKANLTAIEIHDLVKNRIESEDPSRLFSYIKNLISNELVAIGGVKKVDPYSFNNILVYEMADNRLIVHCNVYCNLTVDTLEAFGKKITVNTFCNEFVTIQIVAAMSLVLENKKVIQKDINAIHYYYEN